MKWITKNTGDGIAEIIKQQENEYNRTGIKPTQIEMSDLALTKLFLQDTTQDRIKISGIRNIRYEEQVRQLIHQVTGMELVIEKLEIPDSLRTPEYIEQRRLLELSRNVFNTWWLEGSSDNFKIAIEELGALLGLM